MGTAHNFDSDWDYHESLMTPEEKVVEAIADGGEPIATQYVDWMLEKHNSHVRTLLIDTAGATPYLEEFAKTKIEDEAIP